MLYEVITNIENIFRLRDILKRFFPLLFQVGAGHLDHVPDFRSQRLSDPEGMVLFEGKTGGVRPDGQHPAQGILVIIGTFVQDIDSVRDFPVVMAVVTGVDYFSHAEDVFYEYVETPRVTRVFQQQVGFV